MNITAKMIRGKALELGYDACGVVKTEAMRGYETVLEKRIERFPATKPYYSYFARFAKPEEGEPWSICAGRYGKYKIPDELR